MQGVSSNNDLSTELLILDTLISEQNGKGDHFSLPVNTLRHLKKFAGGSEIILILFDEKNPGWATKKLLGAEQAWKSERAFLIQDSLLCSSITENFSFIDYDSTNHPGQDVVYLEVSGLVKNVVCAPLNVNKQTLGAVIILNPLPDLQDPSRFRFLQLLMKGIANAVHIVEHNRQVIVDTADLEATQWQILNSRNTLRTFFDNLPSSVYIIDRSYTIVAINSRRSDRVGKMPQELVGQKCYEKLHGYSSPCASCHVMDAWNGISSIHTLKELGPSESFVHWEVSTVPILENPHEINQAIIFEEDVTEKWILEANLIQSEKMASIGQLAANVAHEINNPLAAIIANAQLLLRDLKQADEDTIESLKLIETAGNRAAKIVNNLLESARKEKNFEFEEFSVNDSIRDAVSMVNFEIKNRSITVKLNLEAGMPDIFAHKNQLKGVWINLIMNALGAMENKKGILSISTAYENKEYRIVFNDNGKGIPPKHQAHVFEPFFTTKEVGKGTGLGLYVSLQVIKNHHGDMYFETKPGKGTKFIVTLPEAEREES